MTIRCVDCNTELELHSEISDETNTIVEPEPGNLMLCVYCGAVMVLDSDSSYRHITEDELKSIKLDAPDVYLNIISGAIAAKMVRQQKIRQN